MNVLEAVRAAMKAGKDGIATYVSSLAKAKMLTEHQASRKRRYLQSIKPRESEDTYGAERRYLQRKEQRAFVYVSPDLRSWQVSTWLPPFPSGVFRYDPDHAW